MTLLVTQLAEIHLEIYALYLLRYKGQHSLESMEFSLYIHKLAYWKCSNGFSPFFYGSLINHNFGFETNRGNATRIVETPAHIKYTIYESFIIIIIQNTYITCTIKLLIETSELGDLSINHQGSQKDSNHQLLLIRS